jgi:hypothetical protein
MGASRTGNGIGSAIFVCIDAQFEDAVALLSDPDHEVAQPINVTEFNQAITKVGVTPIATWLILPVILVVLLFAGMVFVLSRGVA